MLGGGRRAEGLLQADAFEVSPTPRFGPAVEIESASAGRRDEARVRGVRQSVAVKGSLEITLGLVNGPEIGTVKGGREDGGILCPDASLRCDVGHCTGIQEGVNPAWGRHFTGSVKHDRADSGAVIHGMMLDVGVANACQIADLH